MIRSQVSQSPSNSSSEEIIPKEYIECLKKSFGHTRFRPMQWKVISSILNSGRDNCVIMATGYGKSLCYQFPSVYRNTITIVVSPLISLMQDQVLGLHLNNIRACFLGSAQEKKETSFEVIAHKYNIVYVTPEYITSEAGTFLIERIREFLTLIAIDEAHCISKWGHDFRSAYRKLSQLRSQCPAVPILAMTATATTKVRDDIIQSLQLRDPQIVSTGFDRANLEFMVKSKNNIWADIGPHIRKVKLGSIIVYCITRRMTEEVAAVIEQQGYTCGVYHAGRTLKQRQTTHDDFIHDRIRVIIATIAFGMGINKPDVRLVIHYGVSRDVESYYQEVGRAGRDGLPSKCIMFQQPKDWSIHQLIRDRCKLITTRQHMETLILAMNQYVQTTECRRRFILSYFEEDCNELQPRADCCDNCRRQMIQLGSIQGDNLSNKYLYLDKDGLLDITDETFKIISLVKDTGSKHGLQKIILVLRGSRSKMVPVSCYSHRLYGSLRNKTEKWLRAINNSLLQINMLTMIRVNSSIFGNSFTYPRLTISTKGLEWLHKSKNREPIKIVPSEELIRLLEPKELSSPGKLVSIAGKLQISSETQIAKELTSTTSSTNAKPGIYRSLLKVRSQLARLYDIMPYLIASSRALQQLVSNQPTTMEDLTKIQLDGYSEEKIQRFGPVFLKVIKDYQAKNGKPPMNTIQLGNGEFLLIQQMEIIDQKPVFAKQEPKEEGCFVSPHLSLQSHADPMTCSSKRSIEFDTHPPPKSDELIDLLSDDDDQVQTSDSHDEDVQIMEPSPPLLIEIDSDSEMESDFNMDDETDIEVEPDINDVILNGFDSETESMYQEVVVKTEKPVIDEHSPTSSTSADLDLLVAAIKSENLIENKEAVKETTLPTVNESRNKTDHVMDIFDSEWDLEINDSELTKVSQKAEKQFYSSLTVKITNETKQSSLQSLDPSSNKLNGVISDLNHNSTTQSQKKLRILDRKTTTAFEYEDDSDSDTEHKPIVSPKKRALPSWMQLSNKKKR